MDLNLKLLSNSSSIVIENCLEYINEEDISKYLLKFSICEFNGFLYFYDFHNDFLEFISNIKGKFLNKNLPFINYENFEHIISINMEINSKNEIICSGSIRSEIDRKNIINFNLELDISSLIIEG